MQEYGKSCGICHSEWICRDIIFLSYIILKSPFLVSLPCIITTKKSIAFMAILFYIYDVVIITCGPLATFDLLFLFSLPLLSSSSRPSLSALSLGSFLGSLSRPFAHLFTCGPLWLLCTLWRGVHASDALWE